MDVKNFPVADIRPYDKNPRKNDNAVDAVANSIRTFGFKVPIVIDADNVIVCGHTRYKAALKLGLDSVPCIVADDLSPEQVKAFRLVDNKTAELAEWDGALLTDELKSLPAELVAEYDFDLPTQEDSPYVEIHKSFSESVKSTNDFEIIEFTFSAEQKRLVKSALSAVEGNVQDTFGNRNQNGNALYEIVRQWAAQR